MSTSVTMPRLGESVTEGTVTRWLKQEGDQVEVDEPLLEVSTDKVDTEIPSPAAGVLASIRVREDETVEVGAELAVIEDASGAAQAGDVGNEVERQERAGEEAAPPAEEPEQEQEPAEPEQERPEPGYEEPAAEAPEEEQARSEQREAASEGAERGADIDFDDLERHAREAGASDAAPGEEEAGDEEAGGEEAGAPAEASASYITPLVRRLATEHGVDLSSIRGTGVGGRIRKQDVLDAPRSARAGGRPAPAPRTERPAATRPPAPPRPPAAAGTGAAAAPAQPAPAQPQQAQPQQAQPAPAQPAPAQPAAAAAAPVARGRTEKLSRLRAVIAARMTESLQVSAQLTTVVEADVTHLSRLRQVAKAEFEAREGVRLSFLPFFASAVCEALKEHPKVNASIDQAEGTVTYHEAVHLGVAVDTDRGLLVPVIRDAGDLNVAGLARKIADVADRTRANRVGPDELAGGTFTLTNTGSRGALFDTPIINQPQVGILGTGSVVKRPMVLEDPELGEIVAIRHMVYLALTYDHRLVDGADAARFLGTVKARLEAGEFEAELGL